MTGDMQKIKNVIKNRICCVVSKGKSIEKLQNNITHYRHRDLCWVSSNQFEYVEDAIISQIGKNFDLIADCTTVDRKDTYEPNIRIPRFLKFLERKDNNLLMISRLTQQQCFLDYGRKDILEKYKDKIVLIDDLFSIPQAPKEIWDKPPNSNTLLFAFLVAGGAKKIMVFGMDGL